MMKASPLQGRSRGLSSVLEWLRKRSLSSHRSSPELMETDGDSDATPTPSTSGRLQSKTEAEIGQVQPTSVFPHPPTVDPQTHRFPDSLLAMPTTGPDVV